MKKTFTLSLIGLALSLAAQAQDQPEYYKPTEYRQATGNPSEEYVEVRLSPTDWGRNYNVLL